MGMLGLSQPLGISTPKTSAQLPHSVYVNYTDLVGYIDKDSYRLESPGNTPARLIFTIVDHSNVTATVLAGQRVMWVDNVNGRYLFQGHVRFIRPTIHGPWASIEIECVDLSEILDHSLIISEVRPAETDQSRIDYYVGALAGFPINVSGVTSNATLPATTASKETLRSAIERALSAAAVGADYAIDNLGNLSTWVGNPSTIAPYAITDVAPNNTAGGATISATISPEYDDSLACDAVYVYGAIASGSGLFYSTTAAPKWPLRVTSVDAPDCYDATTARAVANAELDSRTTLNRATVRVIGFDGWARGQTLSLSNGVLGWSAKQLVIQGVNMTVRSGTGIREYELACGSPAPSMSKDLASAIAVAKGARPGSTIVGQVGGPNAGAVVAAASAQLTNNGLEVSDGTNVRVTVGNIGSSYGLMVAPAGGSAVYTIIDGSSNMFKIITSGSVSVAVTGDGNALTDTTLTGLGAWTTIPICVSGISFFNTLTGNIRQQGREMVWSNFWASSTNGGVTDQEKRGVTAEASIGSYVLGTNAGIRIALTLWGNGAGLVTAYGRYQLCKEAAL